MSPEARNTLETHDVKLRDEFRAMADTWQETRAERGLINRGACERVRTLTGRSLRLVLH
jgi:hypothetical protein